MPFISVILVAYNAEPHLSKALKNLQEQTFTDFEVVMVDDGSTDGTFDILRTISENDNRFRFYNKPNGGIASARQFGVEKSLGKYVIHHDADDYMPTDALEKLHTKAIDENADIIIANYNVVTKNGVREIKQPYHSGWKIFIESIIYNRLHAALWNKLIKRKLYVDIPFQEDINYMEDKLILIRMAAKYHPTISYLDQSVYNYVQHENATTNYVSSRSLDNIKSVINILEKEISDIDLTNMKFRYKVFAIINNIEIDHRSEFEEINKKILKLPGVSIVDKILVISKIYGIDFIAKLSHKLRNKQ